MDERDERRTHTLPALHKINYSNNNHDQQPHSPPSMDNATAADFLPEWMLRLNGEPPMHAATDLSAHRFLSQAMSMENDGMVMTALTVGMTLVRLRSNSCGMSGGCGESVSVHARSLLSFNSGCGGRVQSRARQVFPPRHPSEDSPPATLLAPLGA